MSGTLSSVRQYASLVVGLATLSAGSQAALAAFTQFSVGGTTTASSIQTTVDNFRAALGDPNNGNAAGPLAAGRREINWDGGGSGVSSPAVTPLTGFQNRGATIATPGTGFLQTPVGDAAFTAINANYATTFVPFSTQRIFTPLGSNVTDITFSILGSGGATPATVSGFGAVFSDVDFPDTTTMQFFDGDDNSIQTFFVPPQSPNTTAPHGGLSFFGAIADAGERVARVRITTGNFALGPNDNGDNVDVVVLDDFLYDEPDAIPEPAALTIAALALGLMLSMRPKRA